MEIIQIYSLDTLNYRKRYFNYGQIESGNISPDITDNLKKRRLKMSASEMITSVHFLSIMIGDLIPEKDDTRWKPTINTIKIFRVTVKAKFHLLAHYPTIIKKSGPPKCFWSMRYATKHKEFKKYA